MRDIALSKGDTESCTTMLCNLLDQKHDNGAAILSLVASYISHFAKLYCNLSFHERQDICQEVAIKLICHGSKVRENCPRSWVYAIVRNQCISHVRKQNSHVSVFQSSSASDTDPAPDAIGSAPLLNEGVGVEVIEQIDCLQKIFDRIEAQETGEADIAIYTQYAFGLSYLEISRRSKRTVDAVGRRISLLKSRLKNLMSECC